MSGHEVTCEECGHPAAISSPSDTWRCNCVAGVSEDPDCRCDATNRAEGVEDNPPDTAPGEIAQLEARLVELRGEIEPSGEVSA